MRKHELKVVDMRWFPVWMLQKVQRRRGIEHFPYQIDRDVLKIQGNRMKKFVNIENFKSKLLGKKWQICNIVQHNIIQCLKGLKGCIEEEKISQGVKRICHKKIGFKRTGFC